MPDKKKPTPTKKQFFEALKKVAKKKPTPTPKPAKVKKPR